MLQALVVRVGKVASVEQFSTFKALQRAIGIKSDEDWQVLELGNYRHPIVIVARDQDKRLKDNRLNVKGNFAILGMTVMESNEGKTFMFASLEDEVLRDVKLSLSLTTLQDMKKAWDEERSEMIQEMVEEACDRNDEGLRRLVD
jgi:hypothetical protein